MASKWNSVMLCVGNVRIELNLDRPDINEGRITKSNLVNFSEKTKTKIKKQLNS